MVLIFNISWFIWPLMFVVVLFALVIQKIKFHLLCHQSSENNIFFKGKIHFYLVQIYSSRKRDRERKKILMAILSSSIENCWPKSGQKDAIFQLKNVVWVIPRYHIDGTHLKIIEIIFYIFCYYWKRNMYAWGKKVTVRKINRIKIKIRNPKRRKQKSCKAQKIVCFWWVFFFFFFFAFIWTLFNLWNW